MDWKGKLNFEALPQVGGVDLLSKLADEWSALTEKATPVAADLILVEDSAASGAKKKVQIGNIDHDALTNFVAAEHVDWAAASAGTIHPDNYVEGGPGTDTTAIHDDTSGEINAITEKVSPVGADVLVIEDSAASFAKKRVQITNLPGGADADAIHDNVSGEISLITEKVTPVSADLLLIEDSAASNAKKRVQIGNLPGGGGPPFSNIAEANGDITTTSTTDVVATSMTLTPPSGTYMVWFTGSASNSGNNNMVITSIWSAGSQVSASERENKRGAGQGDVHTAFSCMARVTVNGSQAIEGRWRVDAGTGTLELGRTLAIIEVS